MLIQELMNKFPKILEKDWPINRNIKHTDIKVNDKTILGFN